MKVRKILILIVISFLLTGCWDYVGLDEITIVSGIAIDKDEKDDKYNLSFEFISLPDSSKEKTIKTKIIEVSGSTIFDAIRNAKKKVMNKLYFANAQVIIVSEEIAKEDGLKAVINFFLRDAEIRETINLIVSKEGKAKDLLDGNTIDNQSIAFEMKKIIDMDSNVTSATKKIQLYEVFNELQIPGETLALPVFHNVKNDKEKVIEAYGTAVFKKDKLIGTLNASESKYYSAINDCLKGGILAVKLASKGKESDIFNISLEIAKNDTKKTYTYKQNKFKFTITTNTTVYLGEYNYQNRELNEKDISKIERTAENEVKKGINKLIKKAKEEFENDIFDFGNLVYNGNPRLWDKVKKDWSKTFIEADVDIKSTVKIINTSFIK